MDKTAIRNFAIEARKILMKSAITEAGFYGITKDGCKDPVQKGNDFEVYETVAGTENRIFGDDIKRRANLVQAIKTLGFEQVIEETAYTWFNRIIAIRFMEVNNYLPTRVRVLSSETGSGTPDIITQADTVELNLTSDELEKIQTAKRENRYDDAFRMLFIKQCNELNAILPGLFEKTDDYMELLLKITYTGDGVIRMLVDSIPEDNFNVETEGQVEIIGWMYQYYNTELKDDTFAKLKKNVKITKERIPAATQLFTPDWIVRYMVENSLGRVWIEHLRAVNPSVDEKAKAEEFGWKYYLPEAEQEDDVQARLVEIRKSYKDLTPQDITCIDPCMGSGHILVYMFDVLMDIYRSEGFSEREAVFDILEKNIRGLDIDRRAYQLSYFALMMKARGYNRIFFRGHEDIDGNRVQAVPRVYAIEESNSIDRNHLKYYGAELDEIQKNNAINQMNGLLDQLKDAREYGSILAVDNFDWKLLRSFIRSTDDGGQMSLISYAAGQSKNLLKKLIEVGETLSIKYNAVITNPPYMGGSNMSPLLQSFCKENYDDVKGDIYAVFIKKIFGMLAENGFEAMVTMHTWMFISSFEKFRNDILHKNIINIAHHGSKAFENDVGTIVQTVSFVIRNCSVKGYLSKYERLTDFGNSSSKEMALRNHKCRFYYQKNEAYEMIPGQNLSYWLDEHLLKAFENEKIETVSLSDGQTKTGDNDKYLRRIWEVNPNSIGKDKKWAFIAKGGSFRKWYGNIDTVIDWSDTARTHYRKDHVARIAPEYIWFKHGFVFNHIAESEKFAVREIDTNTLFETAAPAIFIDDDRKLYYIMGYLNTWIAREVIIAFNPTFNTNVRDITTQPIIWASDDVIDEVNQYVKTCIKVCKEEWDSFETSADFKRNPLVCFGKGRIEDAEKKWSECCDSREVTMEENEKQINEFFTKLYNLENSQMDSNINYASLYKADVTNDIKLLVSYAVGCMFGRYSLEQDGVVSAGGAFDESLYGRFPADTDAIIPITDEQYFEDDIVTRFEDFVRVVFGEEFLEENLDYIAEALGTKGKTSRERIRTYFLNNFYKDHCSIFSSTGSGKRPIYWLFDSGKENGFKCLIYMHRYKADTVGIIRSDYLTRTQNMIENALKNAEYAINSTASAVDRAQATKKRDKYIKQLAEIRAYYPALSHIALQRIELELDDGVKTNYEKFQGIEVSTEGEKKQKIDLLAKF